MMDLRKEFQQLLDGFGQSFLLFVQSRSMRCETWDGKEHDAHCMYCGGSGWAIRKLKRRAIPQNASDVISHSQLTKPTSVGDLWSPAYVFYFEPNIPLKPGDTILEVGWRQSIPWGLKRVFEIKHVDVMRDHQELPAYLYAGSMMKTLDSPFYKQMVNHITRSMQQK